MHHTAPCVMRGNIEWVLAATDGRVDVIHQMLQVDLTVRRAECRNARIKDNLCLVRLPDELTQNPLNHLPTAIRIIERALSGNPVSDLT